MAYFTEEQALELVQSVLSAAGRKLSHVELRAELERLGKADALRQLATLVQQGHIDAGVDAVPDSKPVLTYGLKGGN